MDEPYLDTTVVDEKLVASISRLLVVNNIPCILWGNWLLTVYGVPSIVDSIDFLVPDELVDASVAALQNRGLFDCEHPATCTAVAERRPSPPPAAHFHIDPESELTVAIYQKSSALWFLPDLELSPGSLKPSPDIILASDPRLPPRRLGRGQGAFQPGHFPVCIPSAHRLLESYIRCIVGNVEDKYRTFWMAMISYIEEYVDGDGFLEEALLEHRCRAFYSGLKADEKPVIVLLDELMASFAAPVE